LSTCAMGSNMPLICKATIRLTLLFHDTDRECILHPQKHPSGSRVAGHTIL
jgi:hypothetical protein